MSDKDQPEMYSARPILVLGLGNILLRDEGVGVRVIEALARRTLPPEVELCDGGTAGPELLAVLEGRRKVVVIDAIDGPYRPGTIIRLRPDDLAGSARPSVSLHELGLPEILAMAEQLGTAPADLTIFGVKPYEVYPSLELSPEMAGLVPRLTQLVLDEVTDVRAGCGRGGTD